MKFSEYRLSFVVNADRTIRWIDTGKYIVISLCKASLERSGKIVVVLGDELFLNVTYCEPVVRQANTP